MATFLLIMIYLAFISLGLPDSLLGAAWPVMRGDLDAPLASAGWIGMIVSAGTIVSSLVGGKLTDRLGVGKIAFISSLLTASALLGMGLSPSLFWLLLLAVPLGIGAGAVDSGLNHYVSLNYKAHHMSWLHCFWGVGATLGPILMSYAIDSRDSWRDGYTGVALIQFLLAAALLVTLPLWRRAGGQTHEMAAAAASEEMPGETGGRPLRIPGVPYALLAFLFYCAAETTVGLWGGSYLVNVRGMEPGQAARWVSLYYAGITAGRFLTGFATLRIGNRTLIRTGQAAALAGAALLLLPLPDGLSPLGLVLIGLGFAPIFPCMLHETPARFGKKASGAIMGYQMAVAYTGSTLFPPLLGWIASHAGIGIFPYFLAAYALLMLLSSEKLNHLIGKRRAAGIIPPGGDGLAG